MEEINCLKHLISGYLGVQILDSYELKVYVLKDIEDYIKSYIKDNKLKIDLDKEKDIIDKEFSLRTKLQDALETISKVNAPIELMLLINVKLKSIENDN